jgi:vacuolar protein-sorting-associated protein 4
VLRFFLLSFFSFGVVSMSQDFISAGSRYAEEAIELDEEGDLPGAVTLFHAAIQSFETAIKYNSDERRIAALQCAIKQYANKIESLQSRRKCEIGPLRVKTLHSKPAKSQPSVSNMSELSASSNTNTNSQSGMIVDSASSSESESITRVSREDDSELNVEVVKHSKLTWADVAGLKDAIRLLSEAVIMPTKYPSLFKGKRKPWHGILLYGPPGTGKSHLAKVLAAEAQHDTAFFNISASDLLDKYLGGSEKNVKKVFDMARAKQPAIIFIDEIDSLCSVRTDGEHESTRRVKTELFTQMQGVTDDNEGLFILAATNRPFDLDIAALRRFDKRIFVALPDEEARKTLLQLHIGDTPHTMTDSDFASMAASLEGYSGSDIKVVVKDALYAPLRAYSDATHFRLVSGSNKWAPCSSNDSQAVSKTLKDIDDQMLHCPPVSVQDMRKSMASNKSSVAPSDLNRLEQWTLEHGSQG